LDRLLLAAVWGFSHGFRYTRHLTLSGSYSSKTCLWLPHSQCNWNWIWTWSCTYSDPRIRCTRWLVRLLLAWPTGVTPFSSSTSFWNKFLNKSHLKVMARVVSCRRWVYKLHLKVLFLSVPETVLVFHFRPSIISLHRDYTIVNLSCWKWEVLHAAKFGLKHIYSPGHKGNKIAWVIIFNFLLINHLFVNTSSNANDMPTKKPNLYTLMHLLIANKWA